MVAAAYIYRDVGMVNRCHYFYPDPEMGFEYIRVLNIRAGNKVSGKYNKIYILAFNLSNKLTKNNLIDSIIRAAAVAGNNKFPGLLSKTYRRKCRQKKNGKN
jgi:hypothetical protein